MQMKELKEKELVNKEAEVDELKPHLAKGLSLPVGDRSSSLDAQGNVRPHAFARRVAAVAAARSVAKPLVSLQVCFYNIGWTDSQLFGENHQMHRKPAREV